MPLTLDESGTKNTLNATWATGEKVYVYNTDKHATLDGYLEAKSDGTTVTLDGNLTGTVDSGDLLVIGFPQVNQVYTGQDGTLATIASTYDYALGGQKSPTSAAEQSRLKILTMPVLPYNSRTSSSS